ncbi:sorting nexin-29-like [Xenia sp. Carnegie-2017]|uniref:sorting nexin-29-like n=1 Tax=Xenia sp. Carnegie-2017 TaxID=2897299 RepID=UPI001F04FBCF|nr:sorting nexin-29-like [Xenia sp. Carnegie-2017]
MEEAPENERLSSIILSPESDVDEVRKEENKDFERKLIQVADMHGELIELNERLQKMLNAREYQLRILKEELVNLRGPESLQTFTILIRFISVSKTMNGMFTKDTRIFMPYIRRQASSLNLLHNSRFPKKIIGNRDVNFVETRRKQLENYLRKLINYSLGAVPELGENPCKSSLFKYFPFFMQTSTVSSVSTTTTTKQTVPSTHNG